MLADVTIHASPSENALAVPRPDTGGNCRITPESDSCAAWAKMCRAGRRLTPEHWVFAATGLKQGEEFGARDRIVGYECDGCEHTFVNGRPVPTTRDGTPENFLILALAPASWPAEEWQWLETWEGGRVGNACMGIAGNAGGRHGVYRGDHRLVARPTG